MGGLSIWHWLIVLLVVVLIFGTKKLTNIGKDVGGAVKGFKDAMNEEKGTAETAQLNTIKTATPPHVEGEVVEVPVKVTNKKRPVKNTATKTTAKPITKTATTDMKAPVKKPTARKSKSVNTKTQ